MGLKTHVMNVTYGDFVPYHTFLEYGSFAGDIGSRQNGAKDFYVHREGCSIRVGTLQERGQPLLLRC